jgi:hypothetical protein
MIRNFRARSVLDAAYNLRISVLEYVELEEGKRRFGATQLMELSALFQVNVAMFFRRPAKIDVGDYQEPNPSAYDWSNDNAARRSPRSDN